MQFNSVSWQNCMGTGNLRASCEVASCELRAASWTDHAIKYFNCYDVVFNITTEF